jgi:hypothetical protein
VKQDLRNLKKLTHQALKQDIDFFYLRTRLAITAFNKKNYDLAYIHFKEANLKAPDDTIVQEYLFYSLKNNFRTADAESFARTLTAHFQEKFMKTKEPFLIPILSVGTLLSPQIKNEKNVKGTANVYAEGVLNGNLLFQDIGLQFRINHKNKLSVGFSNFSTNAKGFVQTTLKDTSSSYKTNQLQTNLYYNRFIKKGLSVGLGAGYYTINSTSFSSTFSTVTGYKFNNTKNNLTAYSILANVHKRRMYHSIGLQLSMFNMSSSTQKQVSGNFNLYPLGNTKIILGTGIHETFSSTNTNFIYHFSASVSPKSWIQISSQFWKGNLQNFVGDAGFVVYNTADPVKQLIDFKLDFFLKKCTISPSISFQKREHSYLQYNSFTNSVIQKSIYSTQSINLSFLWKF